MSKKCEANGQKTGHEVPESAKEVAEEQDQGPQGKEKMRVGPGEDLVPQGVAKSS